MSTWQDVPCKVWTGARNTSGYGERQILAIRKSPLLVHRLAWEEAHGPIPEGMCVCHHCDNRVCYELAHLFLGTPLDNARDMVAKGRSTKKLTWAKVRAIRVLARYGVPQNQIAELHHVGTVTVSNVVRGKTWQEEGHKQKPYLDGGDTTDALVSRQRDGETRGKTP